MASCFPISETDASREIRELIKEKGIDALTSKIIRKHLQSKFNCDTLANHKALIDSLTLEQINQIKKEKDELKEDESLSSDSAMSSECEEPLVKKEIKNTGFKRAAASVSTTTIVKKAKSNCLFFIICINLGEEFAPIEIKDTDLASTVKRRRQCVMVKKTAAPRKRKTKEPGETSTRKGASAFSKICVLSDELTAFFDGERYLCRSDVVKKMWVYFRSNDLMDPKDRRMVVLDDKLKTVINSGAKRILVILLVYKLVIIFMKFFIYFSMFLGIWNDEIFKKSYKRRRVFGCGNETSI